MLDPEIETAIRAAIDVYYDVLLAIPEEVDAARAEQQTCSSTGAGADAAQAPRIDLRPRRLRGAARQSAAAQSP